MAVLVTLSLSACAAAVQAPPQAPLPLEMQPARVTAADKRADEAALWTIFQDTSHPDVLEAYLHRYSGGQHASEARERLEALREGVVEPDEPIVDWPRACTERFTGACREAAVRQVFLSAGSVRVWWPASTTLEDPCYYRDGRACSILGVLSESSAKTSKDFRAVAVRYMDACRIGDGLGCLQMGRLVTAGRVGQEGDAPSESAAHWFEEGCRHQDVRACSMLGRDANTVGAPDDIRGIWRAELPDRGLVTLNVSARLGSFWGTVTPTDAAAPARPSLTLALSHIRGIEYSGRLKTPAGWRAVDGMLMPIFVSGAERYQELRLRVVPAYPESSTGRAAGDLVLTRQR